MNPSISIILPTKDRRQLLERAVASIRAQSVLPEEVVIVNDGSSDGTKELLSALSIPGVRITAINNERNRKMNAARNQAIRAASSDWVAWLDDDDELLPDAVRVMKERIAGMPESFNVAYFNTIIDRGSVRAEGGFRFGPSEEFHDLTYFERMTKLNIKGDCKPVFRRKLFDDARYLFPESFSIESHTMNLIARNGKGIRCFRDLTTLIHLDDTIEHLAYTSSKKDPWPLLKLHFRQLIQHAAFYAAHPVFLGKNLKTMAALAIRCLKISK